VRGAGCGMTERLLNRTKVSYLIDARSNGY
jgi:hypothetical protein